jgi:hypothetical protein
VKTAYDDGGLSGGTMERPALQRLLADISQGLVDVTPALGEMKERDPCGPKPFL